MPVVSSSMMSLGAEAPDFSLPDTLSGRQLSLDDCAGDKGALVMFICNHCPYVVHIRDELLRMGADYAGRGVGMVAISVNDAANYPDDSPEKMAELAQQMDFPFPYLYDESQQSARDYDAVCTPDFFLFDEQKRCVYRGQFDDSRPGNDSPVNGKSLRDAIDCLIEGRPISDEQTPSMGCSIKWRE